MHTYNLDYKQKVVENIDILVYSGMNTFIEKELEAFRKVEMVETI